MKRFLLFPFFGLALASCELDRSAFDAPLEIEGPVPAGGALHWLDGPRNRLLSLRPGSSEAASCQEVPPLARSLVADGDGLRFLAREGRQAYLVHRRDDRDTRIPLPALFDRIHLSPSGEAALLLYDPQAPPLPGEPAARNIARFGVVDLERGEAELVPIETGGLARAAVFSDDGSRAAVLLDRGVMVLDPARPDLRRLAHLELATGVSLRPLDARFAPGGTHLVVRAEGLDDLLVFEIRSTGSRLDLVLNFLAPAASGRLRSFEFFEGGRIAALVGSRVATLDLGGDTTLGRIRPLMGAGEELVPLGDGKLLVTGKGEAGDSFVAVWDPETEDLDQSRIEGEIGEVVATEGRIFVTHSSGFSSFLTVVEVAERGGELRLLQQSFPVAGQPTSLALGAGSTGILLGSREGDIVIVDGESLAIDGLRLDAAIERIGTIGSFLFAIHSSHLGDITLVPLDDLERGAARRFEGLFFSGLMECE